MPGEEVGVAVKGRALSAHCSRSLSARGAVGEVAGEASGERMSRPAAHASERNRTASRATRANPAAASAAPRSNGALRVASVDGERGLTPRGRASQPHGEVGALCAGWLAAASCDAEPSLPLCAAGERAEVEWSVGEFASELTSTLSCPRQLTDARVLPAERADGQNGVDGPNGVECSAQNGVECSAPCASRGCACAAAAADAAAHLSLIHI